MLGYMHDRKFEVTVVLGNAYSKHEPCSNLSDLKECLIGDRSSSPASSNLFQSLLEEPNQMCPW